MSAAPAKTEEKTTAKKGVSEEFGGEPPKGFEQVGNPDIDGWWTAKVGLVFTGEICGFLTIENKRKDGTRDVVLVRLSKPTLAIVDEEEVRLEAGKVLAVGVSYKLRDMLSYVEHKGQVWAKALEKKDIGGSQSMWQYDLRVQGKKAAPPRGSVLSASDDTIPF